MPRQTKTSDSMQAPEGLAFTNVNKLMYPEKGYTKGDVLRYYLTVAPLLLPHLQDRPVTLQRLPDGVTEKGPQFWQKNTPAYYPKWIPRVNFPTDEGKRVEYTLVNDVQTLMYLVNQGALTFHTWLSKASDPDEPDYVIFDLDRGEASFADIVAIAKTLREELEREKTKPLIKTSGKSGLHVMTSWRKGGGFDAARGWAIGMAERVVEKLPKIATMERMKAKRGKRAYVDVMQNGKGKHVVPPYVLRATAGAGVSTPLDWKEVNGRLNPAKFDLEAAIKRFAKVKKDPLAGLLS